MSKLTRRTFLSVVGMASVCPMPPSLPQANAPLPDWDVLICEAGTTAIHNLLEAFQASRISGRETRFTFNYHQHFAVFPNGQAIQVNDSLSGERFHSLFHHLTWSKEEQRGSIWSRADDSPAAPAFAWRSSISKK